MPSILSIELCLLTNVILFLTACGGGTGSEPTLQMESTQVSPAAIASSASAPESPATAAAPVPLQGQATIQSVMVDPTLAATATTAPATATATATLTKPASAGYYVDASAGNDRNDGSTSRPWKTLSRLKSIKLKANESIFLRCGSVWRESLVLDSTQLIDGAQITSYGANCDSTKKPIISGANDYSGGWTKSGAIWFKPVPTTTPKMPRLFVNKNSLRVAQWPNSTAVVAADAVNRSISSSNRWITISPEAATLLQGRDIKDATVQVRTEPWMIESKIILSQQGSNLFLSVKTNFNIDIGDNFVLQDKFWMLDEPGEFYHDTAKSILYFYPPKGFEQLDANALTVEGSTRDTAIVISGRKGLILRNVAAEMAKTDGIIVNHAPAAVVDGVNSLFNTWSGLRVNNSVAPDPGVRSVYISNGQFADNSLSGIDVANTLRATISNNTVLRTGHAQAEWSNAGIIGGDGAIITGNNVEKSGFRGIQFSGAGDTQVANNTVKEFCLQLSDCGAIYTYTHVARSILPPQSFVTNNLIEGSSTDLLDLPRASIIAGIYIDDNSQNFVVQGNTVHSTNIGLYLHNGSNSLFERNYIWRPKAVGLLVIMDRTDANRMTGNIFRYNDIAPFATASGATPSIPKFEASVPIRFLHAKNGANSIVMRENIFSRNRIISLTPGTSTATEVGFLKPEVQYSNLAWTKLNSEIPEVTPPVMFTSWKPTLGPERMFNGNFDRGLGAWSNWFSTPAPEYSVTVATDITGCEGQCAKMTSGSPGDLLSSPHFQLTKGTRYQVTFTASFFDTGEILHPDIARPTTPYDSFIDSPGLSSVKTTLSGQAGDKLQYEAAFTANATVRGRMNLKINTPNVPVSFDSISLKEILDYKVAAFSEWGAVVFAPAAASRTVDCKDLGWPVDCKVSDVNGNLVPMPTGLKPGSAKFLLLTNSLWKL